MVLRYTTYVLNIYPTGLTRSPYLILASGYRWPLLEKYCQIEVTNLRIGQNTKIDRCSLFLHFFMKNIYSIDFVRLGALQVLSFFRHPCSFILKSTINPIVSPQRELNIEVKYCEYMSKYYKYILEIS